MALDAWVPASTYRDRETTVLSSGVCLSGSKGGTDGTEGFLIQPSLQPVKGTAWLWYVGREAPDKGCKQISAQPAKRGCLRGNKSLQIAAAALCYQAREGLEETPGGGSWGH